ncbi:c-type cytochrome [Bartonella sp. HY406]|uniref:c-type cytochrome n=1 Tax=Bartonella sp. HY406 TaxID=2979331 RepID=UPI0021CA25CB|nr:c-type cytochrome [Bartonella sp. HY406]UXN04633.1 c-type cytochrome [Bartonella sp. HY406]
MKTHLIKYFLPVALFILPLLATAQEPLGDIERGSKIYKRCAVCHLIDNDKNRVGPSLQNIINRTAGSLPNFRYSPAMKKAGEDGLVWNKDTLREFLLGPQAMIKGNRMANIRFAPGENLDDLIAYILKESSNRPQ